MTRLTRATDRILALFLILLTCTFAVMTIAPNTKKLYDSARLLNKLKAYMPEDYNALDLLNARIRSLEKTFGDVIWHSDELGHANASLQYALGKDMISTGGNNMLRLASGDLYDIQPYVDTSARMADIARFAGELDVPFTYLHVHPTIYGENALTGGYAVIDKGDEMSDEIVQTLRAAGVTTLDSREMLAGCDASDIVMRTDQHWTLYAALLSAGQLAGEMGLDAAALDPAQFETHTYPDLFFGKYGQRVGRANVLPDDMTLYWPNYPTSIERYTLYNKVETTAAGEFRDAVIKWDYLEGENASLDSYRVYGLTEDFEHFHNELAPDITLVIFKDSYSAPIASFLSLVARDIYAVDMRKTDRAVDSFIEEFQPDLVLMGYSRQMLANAPYELYDDE
ncbi:MAG: alginate O-acetyltransferase AlgX-related protein [Christensenellales bacterium]|jgi:hypothetical protein